MKKYIAIWDANQQISATAINNIIEHEGAKLLLFYDKENKHQELINNPNISFIDLNSDSVESLYENLQHIDVLNQFIVIDKNLTDDFVFSDPTDIETAIDTHLKKPVSLLRRLLPLLARYPGQFVANDDKEAKKYRIQLFQVHNNEQRKHNVSPLDTYFNNVLNQTPFTHLNYKSTFIFDQYQNFFGQTIVDVIEDNSVYVINDAVTNQDDTVVSEDVNHAEAVKPVEYLSADPTNVDRNTHTPIAKVTIEPSKIFGIERDDLGHESTRLSEVNVAQENHNVSSFDHVNEAMSIDEKTIETEEQENIYAQVISLDNSHVYPSSTNSVESAQTAKLEAAQVDLQRQVNQLKKEYLDVLAKKNKANIDDNQDEYLTDAARQFKEQALSMAKSPPEDL